MPTYEYRCPNCVENNKPKVFEILWKGKSIPQNRECPDCGTISPKIFSTYNFQFSLYLKELGEGRMASY